MHHLNLFTSASGIFSSIIHDNDLTEKLLDTSVFLYPCATEIEKPCNELVNSICAMKS